jgi:hypothetical protein
VAVRASARQQDSRSTRSLFDGSPDLNSCYELYCGQTKRVWVEARWFEIGSWPWAVETLLTAGSLATPNPLPSAAIQPHTAEGHYSCK